jgi:hypothetical protein
MKVICIDGVKVGNIGILHQTIATDDEAIYEGEIYTVLKSTVVAGIAAYHLEEKSHCVYRASRFAPLSDIDENEFERYYSLVETIKNNKL